MKVTIVLIRIKMANFYVSEKWSPLQFGALMRKIPSNALKIIFISFLMIIRDYKYMCLYGYELFSFDRPLGLQD